MTLSVGAPPLAFFALLALSACATPLSPPPVTSTSSAPLDSSPPPRADLPLFSGCTAVPNGGVGWGYICKGFAASVADSTETHPKTLLDGPSAGFREASGASEATLAKMGGAIDESDEIYPLAGKDREGRRLTFTANGKLFARLDAAVVPMEGDGLRLLSCGGQASDDVRSRCHALLEVLAHEPWREDAVRGVPVVNDAVTLVGRPIEIPKECHASKHAGGGVVWCNGELTLRWAESPETAEAERARAGATMPAKFTPLPCRLDSSAGECHTAKEDVDTLWRAEGTVRGTHVVALCTSSIDVFPAMCGEIFSVGARH